jgi:DHA2 family multidrug resistance protein-like MFS transporter
LGAVLLAMIFAVADPHHGQGSFVALWIAAGFAALAGVCSALRLRQA